MALTGHNCRRRAGEERVSAPLNEVEKRYSTVKATRYSEDFRDPGFETIHPKLGEAAPFLRARGTSVC